MPSLTSPPPGLALGIDIGGTSAKLALLRDGVVIHTARSAAYDQPALNELTAKVLAAAPAHTRDPSVRVGLCVPGIVNPEARCVERSLNLPCLHGVALDDFVNAVMGGAVATRPRIVSDARAAAHDFWCFSGALPGRLLALSLGTGVGAAVLDDGMPLIVSGQGPGHIGSMDVGFSDVNPPVARDGALGTLEAYLGLPALRARYGPRLGEVVPTWTPDEPPVAALIRALRIAHAVYRPQRIALLGGVGLALRPMVGAIRARVALGLTSLARAGWTLESADSDMHAAIGAARLAATE